MSFFALAPSLRPEKCFANWVRVAYGKHARLATIAKNLFNSALALSIPNDINRAFGGFNELKLCGLRWFISYGGFKIYQGEHHVGKSPWWGISVSPYFQAIGLCKHSVKDFICHYFAACQCGAKCKGTCTNFAIEKRLPDGRNFMHVNIYRFKCSVSGVWLSTQRATRHVVLMVKAIGFIRNVRSPWMGNAIANFAIGKLFGFKPITTSKSTKFAGRYFLILV